MSLLASEPHCHEKIQDLIDASSEYRSPVLDSTLLRPYSLHYFLNGLDVGSLFFPLHACFQTRTCLAQSLSARHHLLY